MRRAGGLAQIASCPGHTKTKKRLIWYTRSNIPTRRKREERGGKRRGCLWSERDVAGVVVTMVLKPRRVKWPSWKKAACQRRVAPLLITLVVRGLLSDRGRSRSCTRGGTWARRPSPPRSRPRPRRSRAQAGWRARCRCPRSTPWAPGSRRLGGRPARGAR
jgi:hypothetical protein